MGDFAKDMRLLAALEEDEKEGENLMDAARRLIGAFNDMLIAAQPGSSEVQKNDAFIIMLNVIINLWHS